MGNVIDAVLITVGDPILVAVVLCAGEGHYRTAFNESASREITRGQGVAVERLVERPATSDSQGHLIGIGLGYGTKEVRARDADRNDASPICTYPVEGHGAVGKLIKRCGSGLWASIPHTCIG